MTEYGPRGRIADTSLLLKSLDRIEALIRDGTPDGLNILQQELRTIVGAIRHARAGARTDNEALRGEVLLTLLDQVERRVDGMVARPASDAQRFAPFQAAAIPRSRLAAAPQSTRPANEVAIPAGNAAVASLPIAGIAPSPTSRADKPAATAATDIPGGPGLRDWPTAPIEPIAVAFGDTPDMAAALQTTAAAFTLPAGEAAQAQVQQQMQEQAPAETHARYFELAQGRADERAYVPFEMETYTDPAQAEPDVTAREVPARPAMTPASNSIEERIAAANSLPVLAGLSAEERLALFT